MSQCYGRASYWDSRYTTDPEPFDWYQRYSGLKGLLKQHIRKSDSILMAGCGNSSMSEDMYEDGFTRITNIDISRVVVNQMRESHRGKTSMVWQHMNACALNFPDASFNVVLDKGTLDSILCGNGSLNNGAMMCMEVSRVLKADGIFIVISYGIPENRLQYLQEEAYSWRVSVHTVPKAQLDGLPSSSNPAEGDRADGTFGGSAHYVYICEKGPSIFKSSSNGVEMDERESPLS
ncbi:hypothetical protein NSK_001904 [Nannochloropsis salina CCMP1776]|uniref:Methyltransferase type 11 domain-containing protein n=1 Tax=Nannochloropsis salina CCMP1776 TaxID=1027361 RepID=A0A4D9D612_9STRA|nr:hypothetical protein NSK_001904 [Nannochloropsis salina CCMP1776]|eukprot:TFJ86816.1 hypothetical protein NSK_001904 [Nannochloropsis salina CCMP1776]